MCIFARPVLSVDATQIFARLSGTGSQFLAYQMTYKSEKENAMILPIPTAKSAGEDAVRFINLEKYESIFEDFDAGFPYIPPSFQIGCSVDPKAAVDSMLDVIEVGSYVASFVPSLDDFGRLDERFRLPQQVWDKVPTYKDFGFAVFQLAEGNRKPHPMAFEFQTAQKSIFFPTMHIHDGEIHEKEHFDHMLYMQHAGLDSRVDDYVNYQVADRKTGVVRSQNPAENFCSIDQSEGLIKGDLLLHRRRMLGNLANQDTVFKVPGHPTKRSINFTKFKKYAPLTLGVAAIALFFSRRGKLKAMREATKLEEQKG